VIKPSNQLSRASWNLMRQWLSITKSYARWLPQRPSDRWLAAILVGGLSFALLAALYQTNSDWFFTRPRRLDPWYHVGYGLYYENPLFLNDYYKVSRLPWNLYQYLFRSFLLPIPSEIVIHFSLYVAQSVLAYLVCARLFSTQAGLLVGVFTAAFSLLHANGGADYQNAPSGPLFFAVIASILWALGRDQKAFMISGLLVAALIHTNTIYVFFLPLFAATGAWLAWCERRGLRYIVVATGWVCAGMVICTFGLAIINAAFGRSWFFFLPQINYAYSMASDPSRNIWWKPWSMSWVQPAAYLGVIYGMAVIAICEIVRMVFAERARDRGRDPCVLPARGRNLDVLADVRRQHGVAATTSCLPALWAALAFIGGHAFPSACGRAATAFDRRHHRILSFALSRSQQ